MLKRLALTVVCISVLICRPVHAAAENKPLVDRVRESIDRAVQYLRDQQRSDDGSWEVDVASNINKGGWTSLAVLALLNAGVSPDDPAVQRGLKYLRTIKPERTYVVGLQTMVFALAGKVEDGVRIQKNAEWLVKERMFNKNREFKGWTYSEADRQTNPSPDNSNTQYAMLGLHEAQMAGSRIEGVWKSIQDFYIKSQREDGGWGYADLVNNGSTLTMTVAGLCGLIISGLELNDSRETILPNGTATSCGIYAQNRPVARAVNAVAQRFQIDWSHAIFYNLYGIERAGRLTGLRFFGDHDWYREGCEYLVKRQEPEGCWIGHGFDNYRVLATSFALLFLSKGRTPIMINKLVHGPGDDWNNDHSDARNLVEYASRELFKRQPLAWQIFDAKRGIIENTKEELLGLAGDLMQSPIVYFNGHDAPKFAQAEEDLLREYVDQGGFILAEACCGRADFDRGFRDLMQRLFPDTPLRPLPPDHAVWRAHALVKPGSFRLEGIDRGCKTVVIYSPEDMSCLWESNKSADGRAQMAFRLGGNIIAYATGMELPKPRLTAANIVRDDLAAKKIPRGYLKAAQLRHEGDWQPAPHGLRNLLIQLQEHERLMVGARVEALYPNQKALLDYKFLYVHGRNAFTFDEPALKLLGADLRTGGLLFADACCGKKAFDVAFRAMVSQLYPDHKLEPIPTTDELYSAELNGQPIRSVRCRREPATAGNSTAGYRDVTPYLEGVRINNRWVVIYSKYDIGCALEKHQSSDCLGHDYPSAIRLGTAVVRYALNR